MKKSLALLFVLLFALAVTSAFAARTGKEVYTAKCAMCHDSGVAGAPKFGDQAAWKAHLEKGMDHMLENAKKGIGAMPPMGMCNGCSMAELKAAVEYLAGTAK
ncbi:hypothetical protein JCM30471_22590 [Desulfuromonas carbonis]|uniref:c-type cytochrome n=1 Tax=Desulfuromonas sp. DDH964 TaxID=1823759 RepID=UPI00078B60DC|nr:c-type cytochrome [Desulfuromonas sp. DDH964]AMV73839.1 Cytochrome c5 [Desulfuromonas sp. DDH964]